MKLKEKQRLMNVPTVRNYRKDLLRAIINDFKSQGFDDSEIKKTVKQMYPKIRATARDSVQGIYNFALLKNSFDNLVVITQQVSPSDNVRKFLIGHSKTDGLNSKTTPELVTVSCKKGNEHKKINDVIKKIGGNKLIFGFDESPGGITGLSINHRIGNEEDCRMDLFEIDSLAELHRKHRRRFSQTEFFTGDVLRNTAFFDLAYSLIFYSSNFEDYC